MRRESSGLRREASKNTNLSDSIIINNENHEQAQRYRYYRLGSLDIREVDSLSAVIATATSAGARVEPRRLSCPRVEPRGPAACSRFHWPVLRRERRMEGGSSYSERVVR